HDCRVRGIDTEVRCADISVPQQRSAGEPLAGALKEITIHVTVVPALARVHESDPIVVLAGGPGQAAGSLAGALMPLFAHLNRQRDLVFVDQRGTGASHALNCKDADSQSSIARQVDVEAALNALRGCAAKLRAQGT